MAAVRRKRVRDEEDDDYEPPKGKDALESFNESKRSVRARDVVKKPSDYEYESPYDDEEEENEEEEQEQEQLDDYAAAGEGEEEEQGGYGQDYDEDADDAVDADNAGDAYAQGEEEEEEEEYDEEEDEDEDEEEDHDDVEEGRGASGAGARVRDAAESRRYDARAVFKVNGMLDAKMTASVDPLNQTSNNASEGSSTSSNNSADTAAIDESNDSQGHPLVPPQATTKDVSSTTLSSANPTKQKEKEGATPCNLKTTRDIDAKIATGELDANIVASLDLQRLVGGVRMPLGQSNVESRALDEALLDYNAARIERYMQRPARVQVEELETNAYIQGNEDYNIWYNKWSGERTNTVNGRAALTPAMYKCDPDRDSGYTRCSTRHSLDEAGTKYCCLYFAKGCCTKGHKCLYFHRVPTLQDELYLDSGFDIFGRERHAKHRDDMSGVGSFMSESKTLFIGDVYPDNTEMNPVDNLKELLLDEFGKFGRVVSIKMVPAKGVAFVTYDCRVVAEFAKVAMASQPLGKYSTALNVKWSHDLKTEEQHQQHRRKGHDRAAFEHMVSTFESQQQVFQEHFNKRLLMQSNADEAQQERQRRQRVEKLASVLQSTQNLDEDQFKVDV